MRLAFFTLFLVLDALRLDRKRGIDYTHLVNKKYTIKIPRAVLARKIDFSSDELFAITALACSGYDVDEAIRTVVTPICGVPEFQNGLRSLVNRKFATVTGDLTPLWLYIIANRLGFDGVRSSHYVAVPSPYVKFKRSFVKTLVETHRLRKTVFMLAIAQAAGSEVGIDDARLAHFCGVTRSRLYAARARLQKFDLLVGKTAPLKQERPFVVQGEAGQEEIETIVAQLQERITFEIAQEEGRRALVSGVATKPLTDELPAYYEGFLRQQSADLNRLLEQEAGSVGRIPRVFVKGFTDGWNTERVRRGMPPERFAELGDGG